MPPLAPDRDTLVRRFELSTRLAHWGLAVPFLLLLLTGLTNFAPELKALHIGGARLFAWAHVLLGFATLVIAALTLLALLRSRTLRDDAVAATDLREDDLRWLQFHALHPLGGIEGNAGAPPAAKFNAGQKLNALVSSLATAGLLGTGLILGVNYVSKRVLPTAFVASVFPFHTLLALAIIPVVLGHLYLALLHPGTREALPGIFTGRVPRAWARRLHPAWQPPRDD
jgi:formate dehydrogenase subunit gamma